MQSLFYFILQTKLETKKDSPIPGRRRPPQRARRWARQGPGSRHASRAATLTPRPTRPNLETPLVLPLSVTLCLSEKNMSCLSACLIYLSPLSCLYAHLCLNLSHYCWISFFHNAKRQRKVQEQKKVERNEESKLISVPVSRRVAKRA